MYKYSEIKLAIEYLNQQPGLEACLQRAEGDCAHPQAVRKGKKILASIYPETGASKHYIYVAQNSGYVHRDDVNYMPERKNPLNRLILTHRLETIVH